jgi:hypothetical protein
MGRFLVRVFPVLAVTFSFQNRGFIPAYPMTLLIGMFGYFNFSFPSPENGNRSSIRNDVFSSFWNIGRRTMPKNPVILSNSPFRFGATAFTSALFYKPHPIFQEYSLLQGGQKMYSLFDSQYFGTK